MQGLLPVSTVQGSKTKKKTQIPIIPFEGVSFASCLTTSPLQDDPYSPQMPCDPLFDLCFTPLLILSLYSFMSSFFSFLTLVVFSLLPFNFPLIFPFYISFCLITLLSKMMATRL